jgi:hypothetical protein
MSREEMIQDGVDAITALDESPLIEETSILYQTLTKGLSDDQIQLLNGLLDNIIDATLLEEWEKDAYDRE